MGSAGWGGRRVWFRRDQDWMHRRMRRRRSVRVSAGKTFGVAITRRDGRQGMPSAEPVVGNG